MKKGMFVLFVLSYVFASCTVQAQSLDVINESFDFVTRIISPDFIDDNQEVKCLTIHSLSTLEYNDAPIGTEIIYEKTGARYEIQAEPIKGVRIGGNAVRKTKLGYAIIQAVDDVYNVDDFGAIPNDGLDDKAAIEDAILLSDQTGYSVFFPNGVYEVLTRIEIFDRQKNLRVFGSPNTKVNITELGFLSVLPTTITNVSVSNDISRNDSAFVVSDASSIEIGDIVRVFSNSTWETGWNFKENDAFRVKDIQGDTVLIDGKFLFNYNTGSETVGLNIFKSFDLIVNDVEFIFNANPSVGIPGSVITSSGINVLANNLMIKDTIVGNITHRGFVLSACVGLDFENIAFENLEYGILINYSRNLIANNITGITIRHALSPTNACDNFYVNYLTGYGCQGVTDAHACFNIHYDHVREINATQFPNCRALGVKISNSYFNVIPTFSQDYCYWSIQTLVPEYEFLYGEYDTEFDNVDWRHSSPTNFNGLTVYEVRKLIVKNSRTHNVCMYGTDRYLENIVIENSTIGSARINTRKVIIENNVFDGNLFPENKFVFRVNGDGVLKFKDNILQNYNPDSTALTDYHRYDANQGMVFENCVFDSLRRWANLIQSPLISETNISFINCELTNWIDTLPYTLESGLRSYDGSKFENLGGRDYFVTSGVTANRPTHLGANHVGFTYYNTLFKSPEFWSGTNWEIEKFLANTIRLKANTDGLEFDNSACHIRRTGSDLVLGAFLKMKFRNTNTDVTLINVDTNGDVNIGNGDTDATEKLEVNGNIKSTGLITQSIDLGTVKIITGVNTPENNVMAPVGSLYLRDDGGTNTTLYVKESGTGNTGWNPK